MPVYRLIDELIFPPAELTDHPEGLLAIGGDLRPERLLLAYQMGIFPWYSEGQPILWWSPEPRMILEPEGLHVSKSLARVLKKRKFEVSFDTAFNEVVQNCASIKRKEAEGTWIVQEMKEAYCDLHEMGYAHSVEAWQDGQLAGGLYGVSLGRCFFGESMFTNIPDASKVALVHLVELIKEWEFHFIDCQISTQHLIRLGAIEISRIEFLQRLHTALQYPTQRGSWMQASKNVRITLVKKS